MFKVFSRACSLLTRLPGDRHTNALFVVQLICTSAPESNLETCALLFSEKRKLPNQVRWMSSTANRQLCRIKIGRKYTKMLGL